jgi:hypothetical protein
VRPRKLTLRRAAVRDLARREAYLSEIRGEEFARRWTGALLAWLEHRAD